MFNPQRKSKAADIFMQQKNYKLHLSKKNQIQHSLAQQSKRYDDEKQQQHYLQKLQKSKREVRERMSSKIHQQNSRLMRKLLETDSRKEVNPERKTIDVKHFNSYFSSKKQKERIHKENYTMVMRMDKREPGVPSLKQLKKQYKRSRKLAKNCRKLPAIVRLENNFKTKISQASLDNRVYSTSRINH